MSRPSRRAVKTPIIGGPRHPRGDASPGSTTPLGHEEPAMTGTGTHHHTSMGYGGAFPRGLPEEDDMSEATSDQTVSYTVPGMTCDIASRHLAPNWLRCPAYMPWMWT